MIKLKYKHKINLVQNPKVYEQKYAKTRTQNR